MPTLVVQGTLNGPNPATIIQDLCEVTGKGGRFIDACANQRDSWLTLCFLEDDLIELGWEKGWSIVVGSLDEGQPIVSRLDPVPSYNGWESGLYGWAEYGDSVILFNGAENRAKTGDDLFLYSASDFLEDFRPSVAADSAFADYSGRRLNLLLVP